jgi:hypothetical protein
MLHYVIFEKPFLYSQKLAKISEYPLLHEDSNKDTINYFNVDNKVSFLKYFVERFVA